MALDLSGKTLSQLMTPVPTTSSISTTPKKSSSNTSSPLGLGSSLKIPKSTFNSVGGSALISSVANSKDNILAGTGINPIAPKVDTSPTPVDQLSTQKKTVAPVTSNAAQNNFSVAANQVVEQAKTKPVETPINPREQALSDVMSLTKKQGEQGQRTLDLQKEAGLAKKQEELNKINAEAITLDRAYEKQKREMLKNPEGKLSTQLNADVQRLDLERNQQLADIGIRQAVAQGNVELANKIVETAIKAEFEPIANQIESLKTYQQMFNDDLTSSEKTKLDSIIRQQEMDYQFKLDSAMLAKKQAYDLQTKGLEQAQVTSQKQSEVLSNLNLVSNLLASPYLDQVVGLKNPFTYWTPGSNEQQAKNQLNQIRASLSLDNREKLKGSGAISDFEAKILGQAASALGPNLSNKAAKEELAKIKGVFANAAGIPATVELRDPRSGQSQIVQATREGINQAIIDGLEVTYK